MNTKLLRSTRGEASMHTVYAVALTLIAIVSLVGLIVVNSQADTDTSDQTVNISNITPVLSTLTTALSSQGSDESSITLNEATTTTVYMYGSVSDDNGCGDIDGDAGTTAQFTVRFYESGVSGGASCSAGNNDCYIPTGTVTGCTPNTTDVDANFEFSSDFQFYANPTNPGSIDASQNWISYVLVEDENAATANDTATDGWELVASNALNVTASIDYGTLNPGDNSLEKTVTVSNGGNTAIDYTIQADGVMNCTLGVKDIAAGDVAYNLTASQLPTGTDVTTSPVAVDASIAKQTSGTSTSDDDLYFMLSVPDGVAGTCTNTLTFTATANS